MNAIDIADLLALGFNQRLPGIFVKANTDSVAFTKTGAGTVSLKAGTTVSVNGVLLRFSSATPVTMPALVAGTDYAIYACTDGSLRADASFTAPSGYTADNSRKIGGFHYGLVAQGETLVGGSFNTAGNVNTAGMVWAQSDVDAIAGINAYSLWDIKFRPACDPRGMTLVASSFWADIYLCNTTTDALGTSRYNAPIASGTVLPLVPAAFGGNGSLAYTNCSWWVANEIACSAGKRLCSQAEFVLATFGVTEAISLGGASVTPPATMRQPGYTSKWGLDQATGHVSVWGSESSQTGTTFVWVSAGGRGSNYVSADRRALLGGARGFSSNAGSRSSLWSNAPGISGWDIGLRSFCDHLKLV